MTENSIMVIHPYKDKGLWMFDDEATGLERELFVSGADTLLNILSEGKESITALFSATSFPNYTVKLEKLGWDEYEVGTWYEWMIDIQENWKLKVWFCPALFKYFKEAPENIYIQVK